MNSGYIDKKMKELDSIKKMIDVTSGEVRKSWKDKWYSLAKNIGKSIEMMDTIKKRGHKNQ
jgi:hypothetical protein